MLGRGPVHSAALPTRREDCGCDVLPLSTAGRIDQRGTKQPGFLASRKHVQCGAE